ncbi:MAG: hypothetical protein ACMG57_01300 [Candidatus Dojkabacteria bacterium]
MNTLAETGSEKSEGSNPKVEVGTRLGTGGFTSGNSLPTVIGNNSLPITGQFGQQVVESPEKEVDEDDYLKTGSELAPASFETILMEPDIRKVKMLAMRECEMFFTNGLITGRDELDALDHVFSHLLSNIPLEEYGKIPNSELAQRYFEKVKVIVQSYVEYLYLVRGVEWYKLKSFLANVSINLHLLFENKSKKDRSTLKFINTFLPDLISNLSDNKDLTQFTKRLCTLISYIKVHGRMGFDFLIVDWEFQQIMKDFAQEYLKSDVDLLRITVRKICGYIEAERSLSLDLDSTIVRTIQLIQVLNNDKLITFDMNFFINDITRNIRLNGIPSMSKEIFEDSDSVMFNLGMPLDSLNQDSRRVVNQTEQAALDQIDNRPVLKKVSSKYFTQFNLRMYSLINSSVQSNSLGVPVSSNVLKKVFFSEEVTITNPEALIKYFFTILDSAILELDSQVFTETSQTLSQETLFNLVSLWRQEFSYYFEQAANLPLERKLDRFDEYFLRYLGKSEDEITSYVMISVDSNDPVKGRAIEQTFNVNKIVDEYVGSIKRKFAAKIAIANSDFELNTPEFTYMQYALEIFSTYIRTDIRKDNIYYADTVNQFYSDLFSVTEERSAILDFLHHVMRTFAAPHKFMHVEKGKIINTLDVSLLAKVLSRMFSQDTTINNISRDFFGLKMGMSLEQIIVKYLTNPNSVSLAEA